MALAVAFERAEDYNAAISEYEYMLAQQPGSLVAINNLASLLADHRTDKASLERAQTLAASLRHSQVPQFKDTIGWSTTSGDVKAAVPLLEEAAAALPDQAAVRYHLGMGYVASGQANRASQEFKIALSKAPSATLKQAITAEVTKIGGINQAPPHCRRRVSSSNGVVVEGAARANSRVRGLKVCRAQQPGAACRYCGTMIGLSFGTEATPASAASNTLRG